MKPIVALIAAVARNNVIGRDNQLIWNIPADMRYFRETTKGHTVIMGRATHQSIGRALPQRKNIVLTRDAHFTPASPDVLIAKDWPTALALCAGEARVFVLGGAQIYAQTIKDADELYITHIDRAYEGDTFFPTIDASWRKVSDEPHGTEGDLPAFSFAVYKKASI